MLDTLQPRMRVVASEHMVDRVQWRRPRSRKRRVREKWAKKDHNWRWVPKKEVLVMRQHGELTMIVHPSLYERIRRHETLSLDALKHQSLYDHA